MSLYDFMKFATMTEQLIKKEKDEKLEDLNRRKSYGLISNLEYEMEKSNIENNPIFKNINE